MPHPLISKWVSRFSGPKGPSRCIGLDAGVSSIRGIQLRRSGDKVEVAQAESEELPAGSDPPKRAEAVQRVARKLGCPDVPVVAALGGPGTILRRVTFPKMTPAELKSALSFEAEKYIPFKLDEVFFDFSILGDREKGQMEVILAAARKELVNEEAALISSFGTLLAVDLETSALANAWEAVPSENGPEVTGLLHIEDRGTVLDVVRQSQLEFAREIALRPQGQPTWEEWLGQCRASFDFYEDQFGRHVGKLVLSGDGARIAGLKDWLQETSGLPVQNWDPVASLPGGDKTGVAETRSGFAVALGSALRGLSG